MSISKLSKGKKKYLARVYIGRKDGIAVYKNKSFATLSEAKEFESKYINFKNNTHDKSVNDKAILSVVFEDYLQSLENSKKPNTLKSYESNFNKWIRPHLGMFQVGNINYLTINRFFNEIRKLGASEYLVNYTHINLYKIFQYASNPLRRYIIVNPMEGGDKPKLPYAPTESIKFWTKKEAEIALTKCLGSHYYVIITLILNTGARYNEAAALTIDSVDFKNGFIRYKDQLTEYRPKANGQEYEGVTLLCAETKTSQSRTVPLNENALRVLETLCERAKINGDRFLLTSANSKKKTRILIKKGSKIEVLQERTLSLKTFALFLEKLCDAAEVGKISPHDLRHTFAANFVMNGGSMLTLKELLGHRSLSSTQIYAHLTKEYLKSALKIINFGG